MNQIDAAELHKLIEDKAVKTVDGSWALDGTDMGALYAQDHIPGAVFFDLDVISDPSSGLPHMAPTPEVFASRVGQMGVSDHDTVVVYDRQGLFSVARVWWTFRLMGHRDVRVLRGGLPAWKAAGYPTEASVPTPQPVSYQTALRNDLVIHCDQLMRCLDTPDALVLDARPSARFYGEAPEPRSGLRSGHMPGSRSLPFSELVRDGALLPTPDLREIFHRLGADDKSNLITTCGSGVTAAILSLALAETGREARLYDGSWAEWGMENASTPVATHS
ncbi:MAG: sulfurtransferase [Asticcacaulis sp.]|uniref:sulfurtransferase n=1 Tax=Asticcacaulis sp. TaxID=1872648 RepID=UPI003F7C6540